MNVQNIYKSINALIEDDKYYQAYTLLNANTITLLNYIKKEGFSKEELMSLYSLNYRLLHIMYSSKEFEFDYELHHQLEQNCEKILDLINAQ